MPTRNSLGDYHEGQDHRVEDDQANSEEEGQGEEETSDAIAHDGEAHRPRRGGSRARGNATTHELPGTDRGDGSQRLLAQPVREDASCDTFRSDSARNRSEKER